MIKKVKVVRLKIHQRIAGLKSVKISLMSEDDSIQEEIKKIPLLSGRIKVLLIALVIALVAVTALVATQRPSQGGPVVILGFLLLIFTVLLCLIGLFIEILARWFGALRFSRVKFFYVCLTWAVGGVLLIGLQTLKQLQLLDVALVIAFELVLNFYILRRF